ncbi:HET-domain-containing protein, partial [Pyrenochaeta sp. DS3sAY3a]
MFENNSKVYRKLPQENQIIRIVRLKAGKAGDKIRCDLVEGPLANLHFEALSYVWGVTLMPYTIFINDKEFSITSNLHGALKELRHPKHDRLLWIDAICINQNDNIEKGYQVQMMRDIYAKASSVCVWLGSGTKATSSAFEMVQRFASAEEDAKDTVRRELERILEYEWWSRAWIIQEVVMGNHVVL